MASNGGAPNSDNNPQKSSQLSDQEMVYLRRKFNEMDANHDGGISTDELVAILTQIGYKSQNIQADSQSLINELDLDKSQSINFFEFAQGFERLSAEVKVEEPQATQTGQTQLSAKRMLVNEIRKSLQATAKVEVDDKLSEAQKKLQESQKELQVTKDKLSDQKNGAMPEEMKQKLKQQLTETLRNTQKQVEELNTTKKDVLFQMSELDKHFVDSQIKWHQTEKQAKIVQIAAEPPKPDLGPPMSVSESVGYTLGISVTITGFLVWLFLLSQFMQTIVA